MYHFLLDSMKNERFDPWCLLLLVVLLAGCASTGAKQSTVTTMEQKEPI